MVYVIPFSQFGPKPWHLGSLLPPALCIQVEDNVRSNDNVYLLSQIQTVISTTNSWMNYRLHSMPTWQRMQIHTNQGTCTVLNLEFIQKFMKFYFITHIVGRKKKSAMYFKNHSTITRICQLICSRIPKENY